MVNAPSSIWAAADLQPGPSAAALAHMTATKQTLGAARVQFRTAAPLRSRNGASNQQSTRHPSGGRLAFSEAFRQSPQRPGTAGEQDHQRRGGHP